MILKKYLMLPILICALVSVAVQADEEAQKFDNLGEVSSAFPGTGNVMIELGYRYRVLYFAAKQKKWEFAEYQVEEMEELMERFEVISKKRTVAIGQFSAAVFADLEKAIECKKWESFEKSFNAMRGHCMACHAQNEVGFIDLPLPKRHESPVLE